MLITVKKAEEPSGIIPGFEMVVFMMAVLIMALRVGRRK
jgi:hypothetical protein